MKLLTVLSAKGGVGKTMTSRHMAFLAAASGIPTCVIDLDTNKSATKQYRRRLQNKYADEPRVFRSDLSEAAETIKEAIEQGYKLAIIDSPPVVNVSSFHIATAGDFVLIPIKPEDMDEVGDSIDTVKQAGKPGAVLFNDVYTHKAGQKRLANANAIVETHHNFDLVPQVVHHCDRLNDAKDLGLTINELAPKTACAKEYQKVWEYVNKRLYGTKALSRKTSHKKAA